MEVLSWLEKDTEKIRDSRGAFNFIEFKYIPVHSVHVCELKNVTNTQF